MTGQQDQYEQGDEDQHALPLASELVEIAS
jgi:hypothetical protein